MFRAKRIIRSLYRRQCLSSQCVPTDMKLSSYTTRPPRTLVPHRIIAFPRSRSSKRVVILELDTRTSRVRIIEQNFVLGRFVIRSWDQRKFPRENPSISLRFIRISRNLHCGYKQQSPNVVARRGEVLSVAHRLRRDVSLRGETEIPVNYSFRITRTILSFSFSLARSLFAALSSHVSDFRFEKNVVESEYIRATMSRCIPS